MSLAPLVKSNTTGLISFADATPITPLALTAPFERGDFSLTGAKEILNVTTPVERRGRYISEVHGARVYPGFSFSSWLSQFGTATTPSDILDFITRNGEFAAAISNLGAGSLVPFLFDLTFTMEGTDFGDTADHTFTLEDVLIETFDISEDAAGNFLTLNGVVRGAIVGDLTVDELPALP